MKSLRILLVGCLLTAAWGCTDDTSTDPEETANNESCNGGKCDVIGDDDRHDEFDDKVTDEMRLYARSTAMLIGNDALTPKRTRTTIANQRLGDEYMMCPDETFADQPSAGFCTAWLVAPDVMVTNGHCITSQQACESSSVVFDYAFGTAGKDLSDAPMRDIYACERVLAWDYTSDCEVDFAVIKLERVVEDREPLKVRPSDDELDSENLVIIGHPFGLPRKYALNGEVLTVGTNSFTTSHDIFGGNSGSGIIDAVTGEVQGLVTCGGSNMWWEYIDTGWELDRKTGQACDATCDADGVYPDGAWEDCDQGARRRCVCDEDGAQLVWEKRDCLSFEADSDGQCSREARYEESTCKTTPWLCATPTSQHTRHFAHFATDWQVFTNTGAVAIPVDATVESTIEVDAEGTAQALTVSLDFLGERNPEVIELLNQSVDLTIELEHDGNVYPLITDGIADNGLTYPIENNPAATNALQVPFIIKDAQLQDVSGEWRLTITNGPYEAFTLYGWSIQTVVKEEVTELGQPACTEDCIASWIEGPDPILESFEGDKTQIETDLIEGTLANGWDVEIIDETGADYEVFKTRKSQTMSMSNGEFGIVRDFGEDLGGRMLTIDYRYDGDGWFQVWAGNHILISQQAFAQGNDSVAIPMGAHSIRIVLGATDDSQAHEATIYGMEISGEITAEPASCAGILGCIQECDVDDSCQQACLDAGSVDAQNLFWAFSDCSDSYCSTFTDDIEYNDCLQSYCVDPVNTCLAE